MQTFSFLLQAAAGPRRLEAGGRGCRNFLHNLLTADIDGLARARRLCRPAHARRARSCLISSWWRRPKAILIDCAASQQDELVKRLMLYRLRAKVDDCRAARTWTLVFRRQRCLRHGGLCRSALYRAWAGAALSDRERHVPSGRTMTRARIALGLADSDADIGSGELFPHEANLDQLGGVSFSKGCYIGQEVVSRMEHRGTARSRILPVTLCGASTCHAARRSERRQADRYGAVVRGQRARLALLRLDRLAEATAAAADRCCQGPCAETRLGTI